MYTIYTLPNCTFCDQAKALLTQKGYEYEDMLIGTDITREEIAEIARGIKSAPIIYLGEELIGTYQDLKKTLEQ
tara:strand:- start:1313 stop:1534 length:222 start_codon:yes stop_codon:yes gene_type:complete